MNVLNTLKSWHRRIRVGSIRSRLRAAVIPFWRPFLWRVRFLAITGSCGKTTTAQLLGMILAAHGKTHAGVGVNTARGIHRSIVSTTPLHRWCVQELSGHTPGYIKQYGSKLKPKVGIVTMVGTDHLSRFRTPDGIALEKGTLVELLPPDGTAILNADDPRVLAMRTRTRARVVTYGLSENALLRAMDVKSAWPTRLSFTVLWRGEAMPVQTQLVGEHWVTSILAALVCALEEGVPLDKAVDVIENFSPIYARNSPHYIENGPVFILDTAKAPYGTIDVATRLLSSADVGRKTLVIGNISDYSGAGSNKYRRVARDALATGARVVGVGRNASSIRKLKTEFPDLVETFDTSREARDFLAADARPGELILLKSAGSGHIERIMLNWTSSDERCWVEDCGLKYCKSCRYLLHPQPVFRLSPAPEETATAA